MKKLNLKDVTKYVEEHIGEFHESRLLSLTKISLRKILLRKNPYLFKAKNILTSEQLVRTILDAHLSSQEETMFGNFLEDLAIHINKKVHGGVKIGTPGIDLQFEKDGITYVVAIKSGPNWGNSNQLKKMKEDFRTIRKILNTGGQRRNVVAVNGCCYGRDNQPEKEEYLKLCGQSFWEFVSGNSNLYIEIIEPLGHKAREKNEEFDLAYAKLINNFTTEFNKQYCKGGLIQWERIVKLNSSRELAEKSTEEVAEEIDVKEK